MQSQFSAALLSPHPTHPAGIKADSDYEAARRFSIYRNNVAVSLIEALADTFPVVQELVGEDFFRDMALIFAYQHPPQNSILAHYGQQFPDFIEHFTPVATLPYLADMARLELGRVHAYHAADASSLLPAELAQVVIDPEGIEKLQFTFHPSVRIVSSKYSIVTLWAAHQQTDGFSELNLDCPEAALIVRPHLDVLVFSIDVPTAALIVRLLRGERLGQAIESVAASNVAFDLSESLAVLVKSQALISFKKG